MMDIWTDLANGRMAFADYLGTLTPSDWSQQSLCSAWKVTEVVSHMLVIPTKSKGQIFRGFFGSGFNLDKMNAKFVSKISKLPTTELVSLTRSSAGSHGAPPGLNQKGVFNELVVHSADVSEVVGKPFELPMADYVACLEYLKDVQPVFKTKTRVAGLTLRAADSDWSSGSGPLVEGPAKQLLLAMAGRPGAFAHLSGDGVATMRAR
jgi:uncharacterized protein (TIGR03083 family)